MADKTFAEIKEAYDSGKNVVCVDEFYGVLPLVYFDEKSSVFCFSLNTVAYGVTIEYYIIPDGSAEYAEYPIADYLGSYSLTTTDKSLVGAINELNARLNSLVDGNEVAY